MAGLRLSALLALSLLVAACDSGAQSDLLDPTELVGTWRYESHQQSSLIVVSQDQTAIDLTQPGTGTLAVTGDHEATIRHLFLRSFGSTHDRLWLSDKDFGVDGPSLTDLDLFLGRMDVRRYNREREVEESWGGNSGSSVTFRSRGVDISRTRLETFEGGSDVYVEGSLDFALRRYEAGVETLFKHAPSVSGRGQLYTFGADGTYRYEFGDFQMDGMWEPVDGANEVLIRYPGERSPQTLYTYRFEGGALILEEEFPYMSLCSAACFAYLEATADLVPGTAVGFRVVQVTTTRRASPL